MLDVRIPSCYSEFIVTWDYVQLKEFKMIDVKENKGYNGWSCWNSWNVSLWLYESPYLRKKVEDIVSDCLDKEETEEDTVTMVESFFINEGFRKTPDEALVTRKAVAEIVDHCLYDLR